MDALPQTRAVFFDVDFTLIRPGPAFQGGGYQEFCARHGVDVDPSGEYIVGALKTCKQ